MEGVGVSVDVIVWVDVSVMDEVGELDAVLVAVPVACEIVGVKQAVAVIDCVPVFDEAAL